jgi:hypothetical protein
MTPSVTATAVVVVLAVLLIVRAQLTTPPDPVRFSQLKRHLPGVAGDPGVPVAAALHHAPRVGVESNPEWRAGATQARQHRSPT